MRILECGARRNDAEWPFHSKKLQRSHVPLKLCNSPRSGPHPEGDSQIIRNIFINHNTDLLNERSTTGFRIIVKSSEAGATALMGIRRSGPAGSMDAAKFVFIA